MGSSRLGAKMIRLAIRYSILAVIVFGSCQMAAAQEAAAARSPDALLLFENVRVFDGKSETLSPPSHVLVRGNKIDTISSSPIPTNRRADTIIIDGDGRTLMPGLIDMHW